MASEQPTIERHDGDEPWSAYRWIGLAAGVAMLAVAAAGVVSIWDPAGLASEQVEALLGAAGAVTALAVIAALFLVDRTMKAMQSHREALHDQQDAIRSAREEAWERHEEITRQGFGDRIGHAEVRLQDLEAELAALTERIRRSARPSPFGDIHETDRVPGIHAEERDQLDAMGIQDTEQLWMGNAQRIAERLDRDPRTVRRWQREAELMALPHLSPRAAEILADGGVRSIPELSAWQPDALVDHLRGQVMRIDTEPEEQLLDTGRAATWIDNARNHDPSTHRVHHRHGGRSRAGA